MEKLSTPRKYVKQHHGWQREVAIRQMVCVLCESDINSREKPAVKRFRGRAIALCRECEDALKERLVIDEDPMFKILGGYGRLKS